MQSQAERFALTNLAIIAYADKLLPEQMPAILPPIFKVKDHDVLVFPPFHIDGAYVYSDAIGETAELQNQIAADQATFLPTSLGAAPNHELWIDENQSVHYEPWDEVEQHHKRQAQALSSEARQLFYQGEFGRSKQLCQLAIRYFDRFIDPYIVLMAVARIEKKELVEKMYAQAVEGFVGPDSISELVDKLCSRSQGQHVKKRAVQKIIRISPLS